MDSDEVDAAIDSTGVELSSFIVLPRTALTDANGLGVMLRLEEDEVVDSLGVPLEKTAAGVAKLDCKIGDSATFFREELELDSPDLVSVLSWTSTDGDDVSGEPLFVPGLASESTVCGVDCCGSVALLGGENIGGTDVAITCGHVKSSAEVASDASAEGVNEVVVSLCVLTRLFVSLVATPFGVDVPLTFAFKKELTSLWT